MGGVRFAIMKFRFIFDYLFITIIVFIKSFTPFRIQLFFCFLRPYIFFALSVAFFLMVFQYYYIYGLYVGRPYHNPINFTIDFFISIIKYIYFFPYHVIDPFSTSYYSELQALYDRKVYWFPELYEMKQVLLEDYYDELEGRAATLGRFVPPDVVEQYNLMTKMKKVEWFFQWNGPLVDLLSPSAYLKFNPFSHFDHESLEARFLELLEPGKYGGDPKEEFYKKKPYAEFLEWDLGRAFRESQENRLRRLSSITRFYRTGFFDYDVDNIDYELSGNISSYTRANFFSESFDDLIALSDAQHIDIGYSPEEFEYFIYDCNIKAPFRGFDKYFMFITKKLAGNLGSKRQRRKERAEKRRKETEYLRLYFRFRTKRRVQRKLFKDYYSMMFADSIEYNFGNIFSDDIEMKDKLKILGDVSAVQRRQTNPLGWRHLERRFIKYANSYNKEISSIFDEWEF